MYAAQKLRAHYVRLGALRFCHHAPHPRITARIRFPNKNQGSLVYIANAIDLHNYLVY